MSLINTFIGTPLGWLMWLCYTAVPNYGLAIIIFTMMTKVILFPIAIMVQKNAIKMVKMQPRLNDIAAKYADDKDKKADEQIKLYDEEKYSPAAGCLPVLLQIPIILGLIQVIYNPLQHLLRLSKETIIVLTEKTAQLTGLENLGYAPQLHVMEAVSNPAYTDQFLTMQALLPGESIADIVSSIQNMGMTFLGLNLASTPSITHFNSLLWIPLLAGLSALTLCLIQNRVNVLQMEQGFANKWGMTIFLTTFSLYFAFIVPAGVGLYWVFSNVFSTLQLFLLNRLYDPKKYIDYEDLERSKQALARSKERKKGEKKSPGLFFNNPYRKRENADYKRFFADESKQLVFYSEKSGFYKYFENVIDEILARSDIIIHYVTSDSDDAIFLKENPRIIPYYIGDKRLISFMMKIDADMVVMTMPDLQQFHIKRSLVRKDIEYVYMFHNPLSFIMTIRDGALDHYDTIFCTGPHQVLEIRESEKLYHLPEKSIVECGYGLIDNMRRHFLANKEAYSLNPIKRILIAPSWQEDNILDSCIDEILMTILDKGWQITVRPHPEYVKRYPGDIQALIDRYKDRMGELFVIETDFSSNETVYSADILITDWSWVAYEYSLSTKRPSIFINTDMKIANPNWDKLPLTPLNLSLRSEIGVQLEKNELAGLDEVIQAMLTDYWEYEQTIDQIADKYLFNIGESGRVGAEYIISKLRRDSENV